jgi:dTDP-D-glucose 4,6-dehydratase
MAFWSPGGAGFIGSNFSLQQMQKESTAIVNLAN